ncbi:YciI family protein [Shewanella sp. AS1]|uniref:YciI family protein n=1 Tax=Shewanella sp. AS1 TaxID=2907626 RepID=UPI001F317A0C|nr:YciI family protein [Shewanella sp. AS1]MCE9678427.1 YciI family protein [Shewanella sp. AS1]
MGAKMRVYLGLALLGATFSVSLAVSLPSYAEQTQLDKAQNDQMQFDQALATELGADDYGMKQYVMAFLKRGPNRDQDAKEANALQAAHLANIGRLAKQGKLVLAGPFLDDGELRGIYIFNVTSVKEAEELTASDPAIQAGRLVMELHPWYGSAALMQVTSTHGRIAKKSM